MAFGQVRRIRVEGVPADFRVPRGWPTPTDKWVRENVFWQPPPGWAPLSDLRPAPVDWVYWTPNPLIAHVAARSFRAVAGWMRMSNVLAVAFLVTIAGAAMTGQPALRMLGLGFAFASIVCVVVHHALHARITRRLVIEYAIVADRGRTERLTKDYQRYLTAAA